MKQITCDTDEQDSKFKCWEFLTICKVIHSAQNMLCTSPLFHGWDIGGERRKLPHGYCLEEAEGTVTIRASTYFPAVTPASSLIQVMCGCGGE